MEQDGFVGTLKQGVKPWVQYLDDLSQILWQVELLVDPTYAERYAREHLLVVDPVPLVDEHVACYEVLSKEFCALSFWQDMTVYCLLEINSFGEEASAAAGRIITSWREYMKGRDDNKIGQGLA